MKHETIKRLKSRTPRCFKRWRNICVTLTAAMGATVASWNTLPADVTSLVPKWVMGVIVGVTLGGTFFTSLTKNDEEFKKKYESDEQKTK